MTCSHLKSFKRSREKTKHKIGILNPLSSSKNRDPTSSKLSAYYYLVRVRKDMTPRENIDCGLKQQQPVYNIASQSN